MKRTKPPVNDIREMVSPETYSVILSRAKMAARLGQQYGGDRDIYNALGYKKTLEYVDFATQYERQDIAKAIIDRPVIYTWKGPVLLSDEGGPEMNEFEKIWLGLEKDLNLKNRFMRVDKLASLGQYAVLLLGFNDIAEGEEFIKPVKTSKDLKLLYVKPLGQESAQINDYVENPRDPRYGLVNSYNIQYQNGNSATTASMTVHHSRVIHIAFDKLESEVLGTPLLQSVYNRLQDLEKLVGASAEMFWRGARPGFQGVVDKDAAVSQTVLDTLQDQFDEYENHMRRVFSLEGMELKALQQRINDPKGHVEIQIQMISAITGIPQRILTGSEQGELASTQDLTSWYSLIQTRREEYAAANIIRPFADYLIKLGVLPNPEKELYTIEWADLFAASAKDKAEVGRIRSTALKEYAQYPAAEMIMPPEAFMKFMLGLDKEQVTQILDMSTKSVLEESTVTAEERDLLQKGEND